MQPSWERSSATGIIFSKNEPAMPLGSCFALGAPDRFVAAYHCVKGRDRTTLQVNHCGLGADKHMHEVYSVSSLPEFDVAVLHVEVPEPGLIRPFLGVQGAAYLGTPITCIGWPVDIIGSSNKDQLRYMRGYLQAMRFHDGQTGHRYPAWELSFLAAAGLSGAPVFADATPQFVLGQITENFQTTTVLESEEEIDSDGRRVIYRNRSFISYGLATNLWYALPFLEDSIGSGDLNAARESTVT